MAVTTSKLWPAQDALKGAITQAYTDATLADTVGIGWPGTIERDHTWIDGGSDVAQAYEETGLDAPPLVEAFSLTVHVLTTWAGTYEEIRDRLMARASAIETALRTAPFLGASVSVARITAMHLREGVDDDGSRQLGLDVVVTCEAYQ